MELQLAIIERVVGQAPRSFDTGYPGADTNLPSACVELENGDLIFVHGETEQGAIESLYRAVRNRYPLRVEKAEREMGEVA